MKLSYNPLVSIILVNYNGYKDTIECIKSLNFIDYDNYNIIVVDNMSSDGSQEYIREFINSVCKKNIFFLENKDNIGFSGANNVGIKFALDNDSDYLCLLNNDTVVEYNFLTELVNEMEKDKKIGISAGKILYYDNKDYIWSAGGYIDNKKSLGCHFGKDQVDNNLYNIKKDVTFLTGCLQLIKKDVIKEVGLYDNDYFLYMEDVDFCARVLKKGYKLRYIPNSIIYHKVSSSTGGDESPLFLYYITRNRLLYNKKNQENVLKSCIFYLLYAMKLVKDPFTKKKNYKYVLKGVKDYYLRNYGKQEIKI